MTTPSYGSMGPGAPTPIRRPWVELGKDGLNGLDDPSKDVIWPFVSLGRGLLVAFGLGRVAGEEGRPQRRPAKVYGDKWLGHGGSIA